MVVCIVVGAVVLLRGMSILYAGNMRDGFDWFIAILMSVGGAISILSAVKSLTLYRQYDARYDARYVEEETKDE